jgi:hypothetical protein
MDHARYITADKNAIPITGNNYDAVVHGANLLCGDPRCDAEVQPIDEYTYHAGMVVVPTHFRSKNKGDHIPGCLCAGKDEINRAYDNHENLVRAIAGGKALLLDLNFYTGLPGFGEFKSLHEALRANTDYHAFCNKRFPFHVGIKNTNDIFARIVQIEGRDSEALSRLFVAHGKGAPYTFSEFDVRGGKKQKSVKNKVYKGLRDHMAHLDATKPGYDFAIVAAHPYLFKVATIGAKDIVLKKQRGGDGRLLLRHKFTFANENLRRAFHSFEKNHVVGVPQVFTRDIRTAEETFAEGGKATIKMETHIGNEAQFRPTGNAQQVLSGISTEALTLTE